MSKFTLLFICTIIGVNIQTNTFADMPARPEIVPWYMINKTNVVYMEDTIRRILHPDMETFKICKKQGHKMLLALDKNGVYFRGHFMQIDTTKS